MKSGEGAKKMYFEDGLWHADISSWNTLYEKDFEQKLDNAKNHEIKISTHLQTEENRGDASKDLDSSKISFDLIKSGKLFEVLVENGKIKKYTIRAKYDNDRDIAIPIIFRKNEILIKTAWINTRNDKHKTLDTKKYGPTLPKEYISEKSAATLGDLIGDDILNLFK